MKFKENHKTALSKVLSDLVQCDGIVNQGEIDFLHRVNEAFGITSASRKKATTLILSDAVGTLKPWLMVSVIFMKSRLIYFFHAPSTLQANITFFLPNFSTNLGKRSKVREGIASPPT